MTFKISLEDINVGFCHVLCVYAMESQGTDVVCDSKAALDPAQWT